MNPQENIYPLLISSILILLIFLLDLLTSLGVAVGVLYIFALYFLIKTTHHFNKKLFLFGVICSFLTLFSIWFHGATNNWPVIVNSIISIVAIWGNVFLLLFLKKQHLKEQKTTSQQENRFTSLVQSATDGIITADSKGNILSWNTAATQIFGWSASEMIQQPLTKIMPSEFKALHEKGMHHFLQTKQSKVMGKVVELEGQRKGGAIFPLELSLGSWTVNGEDFICGIIRDISSRKQKEEAIHFTQFTIEQADDMILWINPKGQVMHANESACKNMGYSKEEFLAMKVPEFDPKHTIESYIEEAWNQIKTEGVRNVETQIKLKSGGLMTVDAKANYVNYKGKEYNCVFYRDITERKKAEVALRVSQEDLLKTHYKLVEINKAYNRFIPHDFLKILGHNNILDLKLGDSTEVKMTVLFADIRDYSSLSEQMTPKENFKFINAYLGRVGPVIKAHGGFINQYYGDGIMALFVDNHEKALQAAIKMQQKIQDYNRLRATRNRQIIKVGIGLHTGDLMLGIIGDDERNDTGVISDAVNMASRIEGLTKVFGASIIFSEALRKEIEKDSRYQIRGLGKILVKGSSKSMNIYQTFEGVSKDHVRLQILTDRLFAKGLKSYFSRQPKEATTYFQNVLSINPADKAAAYYLRQSQNSFSSKENWQGVEVMIKK